VTIEPTTTSKNTTEPSAASDVLELAARLRLATARLARQLRQQAGAGLSPSQQSALASIDLQGPLTLGQLARLEHVAPPTVTKVVAKLEDEGLVSRRIDDSDRRVVRVQTTAAGRRRLEHARSRRNAWLAQRLRRVDAATLRQLEAALPLLEHLATAPDPTAPDPTAAEDTDATKTDDVDIDPDDIDPGSHTDTEEPEAGIAGAAR
jgi:DNA-binding MarR family transcriptional regulator